LKAGASPRVRARALVAVAISGPLVERPRAALLWGLTACDAAAPLAALDGFAQAAPQGPLARLAARRLEDALSRSGAQPAIWRKACGARWLAPEDRSELCLAAAEALAADRDPGAASLLPERRELSREQRLRALAVRARLGPELREAARREVATEFPAGFADLFPGEQVEPLVRSLPISARLERAEQWLVTGSPEDALREAAALGDRGALVAARAAAALRRPRIALTWALRAGGSADAWAVRCEAYRQLAWAAGTETRSAAFTRLAEAATRLAGHADPGSGAFAAAAVMAAEALTELGRYDDAAAWLAKDGANTQPRWDWVWRRLVFLSASRGRAVIGGDLAARSSLARDRRLLSFWRAWKDAGPDRATELARVASYGLPDLPAQWAAAAAGRPGVRIDLSDAQPGPVAPPAWAADLMTAGRVADVVYAWRLTLQQSGVAPEQWLGLVRLASFPPLDAIPLLLRGEPRLLAGPWSGLPRWLLEAYLPLPSRLAVERAAKAAGVPPWLLAGVVRQESAWNPVARSAAGAVGLTQIMPGTAPEIARWGRRRDLLGRSLTDPDVNLTLGAFHLAQWFGVYRSWTVAIACHNAGERRVRETWEKAGRRAGPEFVEAIEIPETWDYVHRVVLWAEGYRLLYWPDGRAYPWT